MRVQRRFAVMLLGLAALVLPDGGAGRTSAAIIMDQIGPNPTFVQGQNANASQNFGAPYNANNVAVVDNFSITGLPKNLTEVDAAVLGFAGFSSGSYSAVTAWHVEIYSSPAAAASNLTGDVANFSVAPSSVTLTRPYGSDTFSGLASIPINATLGDGTYYIAVIADLSFAATGAEIGVYTSTFGGTPGDSNAFQANPGGGFGFSGNRQNLGVNAAYRIIGSDVVPPPPPASAVPEPSTFALLALGGVALTSWRRWKKRARQK